MQSCCPAEEARLRRRERKFDDPEEFGHVDRVSMPSSPSACTAATATALQEQANGNLDNQFVCSETIQQQQPLEETPLMLNADDGIGASFAEQGGSTPPPDRQHRQGNVVDAKAGEHEPRQQEIHPLKQPQGDKQSDEEEEAEEGEEEEFRPTATMSARGVVRARRQWALRRARRREGPNEANQLELGGGSPAETGMREAWVDTVVKKAAVSSRSGAVEDGSGNGGKGGARGGGGGEGGNGVVELLVSLI